MEYHQTVLNRGRMLSMPTEDERKRQVLGIVCLKMPVPCINERIELCIFFFIPSHKHSAVFWQTDYLATDPKFPVHPC